MPEYGEPLTDREKELLQMVATGVTNRQVAQRLTISVNTVKVHLRNIYAKLGAESRTEATMIAIREGWVSVESPGEALTPEGEGPSTELQAPPAPPLPRFKRVALVAAALLAVTGMALTWPRSGPQLENGPSLPFDQSPEDPADHRSHGHRGLEPRPLRSGGPGGLGRGSGSDGDHGSDVGDGQNVLDRIGAPPCFFETSSSLCKPTRCIRRFFPTMRSIRLRPA